MLWQPPLPPRYYQMAEDELAEAIAARKQELGSDLVILGHHYQQDEVIHFADHTGDSFKLSQLAAGRVEQVGARFVIFAGVHFMAESADILTPDVVSVILPDLGAGCSMADMADYDQTTEAWSFLQEVNAGTGVRVIPICYMNCSAAIKAFCGEHGGAVCTSSNASEVLTWALAGGIQPGSNGDERIQILFIPDQHLGRNTAASLGYDIRSDMVLWNPKGSEPPDEEALAQTTFVLWQGHCSVHKLFRPEHVDQVRALWPDVTVMVHPECCYEVCQKADQLGSTEGIIAAVEAAEPGSRWAIGTEVHLVNRISVQAAQRGVSVRILSDCQCLCTTMYRIDMPHLLWVMDELARGKVVNRIQVHPDVRRWSLVALDRMLAITGRTQHDTTVPTDSLSLVD